MAKLNCLLEHMHFSKKIIFKKLGLAIIDEQHKFGVKQRSELAKKGVPIVMFCLCLLLNTKNNDDVTLW